MNQATIDLIYNATQQGFNGFKAIEEESFEGLSIFLIQSTQHGDYYYVLEMAPEGDDTCEEYLSENEARAAYEKRVGEIKYFNKHGEL